MVEAVGGSTLGQGHGVGGSRGTSGVRASGPLLGNTGTTDCREPPEPEGVASSPLDARQPSQDVLETTSEPAA
jgi:hypothetical protein